MVRGLIKSFGAGAGITANRIVKHGTSDGVAVQAAAATDKLIGVADADAANGTRVDVILSGTADVQYGGTVARGDALTANADGKAVVAATGNRVVGIALVSGVAGDIGEVLLAQH